jgi:hypothetical protein
MAEIPITKPTKMFPAMSTVLGIGLAIALQLANHFSIQEVDAYKAKL